MASDAEAELGALFYNGQVSKSIRTCLEEMGYPQPSTPIKTDNSTAAGIVNSSVRQKKSKTIDMRFYWIKDRVSQKHFLLYWESGLFKKRFLSHYIPFRCIHTKKIQKFTDKLFLLAY